MENDVKKLWGKKLKSADTVTGGGGEKVVVCQNESKMGAEKEETISGTGGIKPSTILVSKNWWFYDGGGWVNP